MNVKINPWNYAAIYSSDNLKPQLHLTTNYLESFNAQILAQNELV